MARQDEERVCPSCGHTPADAGELRCPRDGRYLIATAERDRNPGDEYLGRILGNKYPLLALIGAGGMGRVYRSVQPLVGRTVAVKLVPAGLGPDAVLRRRFLREAQVLGRLSHPGIVTLHDFGLEPDGTLYMVLQYVPGPTLAAAMAGGGLTAGQAITLGLEVLEALTVAHAQGIIHRDIKPENIVLRAAGGEGGPPGTAKLLDFGIAHLLGQSSQLTRKGAVLGTPLYVSPEQALGLDLDARTDLCALGAVLYHCFAGVPPFSGSTDLAVLTARATQEPPALPGAPHVPPGLGPLLQRALARTPGQRFASAQEMAEALRRLDLGEVAGRVLPPVLVLSSGKRAPRVAARPDTLPDPPGAAEVATTPLRRAGRPPQRVGVDGDVADGIDPTSASVDPGEQATLLLRSPVPASPAPALPVPASPAPASPAPALPVPASPAPASPAPALPVPASPAAGSPPEVPDAPTLVLPAAEQPTLPIEVPGGFDLDCGEPVAEAAPRPGRHSPDRRSRLAPVLAGTGLTLLVGVVGMLVYLQGTSGSAGRSGMTKVMDGCTSHEPGPAAPAPATGGPAAQEGTPADRGGERPPDPGQEQAQHRIVSIPEGALVWDASKKLLGSTPYEAAHAARPGTTRLYLVTAPRHRTALVELGLEPGPHTFTVTLEPTGRPLPGPGPAPPAPEPLPLPPEPDPAPAPGPAPVPGPDKEKNDTEAPAPEPPPAPPKPTPPPAPTPAPAALVPLQVVSSVLGAEVYVDGRQVGTAPMAVSLVPPGAHEVVVIFPRQSFFRRWVTAVAGTPALVRAEPAP